MGGSENVKGRGAAAFQEARPIGRGFDGDGSYDPLRDVIDRSRRFEHSFSTVNPSATFIQFDSLIGRSDTRESNIGSPAR